MGGKWTEDNVTQTRLDIRHAMTFAVVADRASSMMGRWAGFFGLILIILPALASLGDIVKGVGCVSDEANYQQPGYCRPLTWVGAFVSVAAAILAAIASWMNPSQRSEKYDTASQDLAYEAKRLDNILTFDEDQRAPYTLTKQEFGQRYDRIVGRCGRFPAWCFKGGNFELSAADLRQLPNFNLIQSFTPPPTSAPQPQSARRNSAPANLEEATVGGTGSTIDLVVEPEATATVEPIRRVPSKTPTPPVFQPLSPHEEALLEKQNKLLSQIQAFSHTEIKQHKPS